MCRVLFVVCCVLRGVSWLLIDWCLLYVVCCALCVLFVVCCVLFDDCWLLRDICRV